MLGETFGQLPCTWLDSLDECTASKVVWLETTAAHEAKESPSFMHLVAAHEDIDQGVEGDISWSEAYFTHVTEKLFSFLNHALLSTTLD